MATHLPNGSLLAATEREDGTAFWAVPRADGSWRAVRVWPDGSAEVLSASCYGPPGSSVPDDTPARPHVERGVVIRRHDRVTYRYSPDGSAVEFRCASCGEWTPVWGAHTIRVGKESVWTRIRTKMRVYTETGAPAFLQTVRNLRLPAHHAADGCPTCGERYEERVRKVGKASACLHEWGSVERARESGTRKFRRL